MIIFRCSRTQNNKQIESNTRIEADADITFCSIIINSKVNYQIERELDFLTESKILKF